MCFGGAILINNICRALAKQLTGATLRMLHHLIKSSPLYQVGAIIPILYMGKLRLRESLAQGHMASHDRARI